MPVPDTVEEWICERCGADLLLYYLEASTPGCYGRWYCAECYKICRSYRDSDERDRKWKKRKKNEH